ncbi:MAG TPA: flagellin [Rhodoblastus sp.]|nr:flagellin [Rhodoblastus sp.]
MTYLLTNASALTALQSLTMTQNSLAQTQSQLSTGLAIQHASDNTSYWSISQTMSSDNGALGAVSSALKESSSMLSTFTSALEQSISVVNNIKNDLVAAQNPGANLTQIQTDIAAQQASLTQIVNATTFNGQNWLQGDSGASTGSLANGGTQTLVGGYTNAGGVTTISVNTTKTTLIDSAGAAGTGILSTNGANYTTGSVLTLDVSGAGLTDTDFANMLKDVNAALGSMETAGAALGSATNQVSTQQTYISSMQSSLSNGVASLVDADMNQVSTRLQALQTQQQLGVQSLSIANQSSQMILKLFQ